MPERYEYDVVVIGAGSTGENVAGYVVRGGLTAAVVESELVGGECSYWACMPSKALLRPGEALARARGVPGARTALTGTLDVDATLRSRDAFTSDWDDGGQVRWLTGAGAALFRGTGRLAGERAVEVTAPGGDTVRVVARRAVVIATGSRAAVPPVEGLGEVAAWGSREATSARRVPPQLLVLGGGVVGVEMAQAYRDLGSEVTVVERARGLLPTEEPFAGAELAEAFDARGIRVLTGVGAAGAARSPDTATVTLALDDGGEVSGDELLVATGRVPRTEDIGVDTVGLRPGGFLPVDDRLLVRGVAGEWLYAAGDVNGRALLTHQGKYQARLLADVIAGKDQRDRADDGAIPRVVFTDPQVAAVGRTESQAREAGLDVKTVRYDVGGVAGGALVGEGVRGTAQLVVDTARRTVVGATFVGPGVGELLHAATIAVVGEVSLETLWHAVPAFPTMSEVWLRLLEVERGAA